MHPTGLYPEQDPARDRHPQATLYASLELSRSTWLVTSLAPDSRKIVPVHGCETPICAYAATGTWSS